jgi:hypothetical protein
MVGTSGPYDSGGSTTLVSWATCTVIRWWWHGGARPCLGSSLLALAVGSRHKHLWTTRKTRHERARMKGLWVTLATVSSELGSAPVRPAMAEMHSHTLPWLKRCCKRVEVEQQLMAKQWAWGTKEWRSGKGARHNKARRRWQWRCHRCGSAWGEKRAR